MLSWQAEAASVQGTVDLYSLMTRCINVIEMRRSVFTGAIWSADMNQGVMFYVSLCRNQKVLTAKKTPLPVFVFLLVVH
jgi:hypothetical protein